MLLFHVQPNYNVEIVLRCVVVGVVTKREKKKRKTFLVATNIIADRLPERRPIGMPTARANVYVLKHFAQTIMCPTKIRE